MIDSWDTKCDRQNFLSIWTIFCPFSTVTAWKITILKNWKKRHDKLIILHICTINDNHIMYDSWATKCDRQKSLLFWTIFCPFKIWEKRLEISLFYICVPKIMITWCTIPEMWCATDRQTDGWTEKVTYKGGWPK